MTNNFAPKRFDDFKRGFKERNELRDGHQNDIESVSSSKKSKWRQTKNNLVDVNDLINRLSKSNCHIHLTLDQTLNQFLSKPCPKLEQTLESLLHQLAQHKKKQIAFTVWSWMRKSSIKLTTSYFNAMIQVLQKGKDGKELKKLLRQMDDEGIKKNENTYISAISACSKGGQSETAIALLNQMKNEGLKRNVISFNSAIKACADDLQLSKAIELFQLMKKEQIKPNDITYCTLISVSDKGQNWKLALKFLQEMKQEGYGINIIAYSSSISALSKGHQWESALQLFEELEKSDVQPNLIVYNATMSALVRGMQWRKALDLFEKMKQKKELTLSVVSYSSAISACEKGLQWERCLLLLDEMTEKRISKNVIVFGAAVTCMEKCSKAEIAFQLMEKMKHEGVTPNVHIYNSLIFVCARCKLWKEALKVFYEMDQVGIAKDIVTYNALLDSIYFHVKLARNIFKEGHKKGFYSDMTKVDEKRPERLQIDLHFLSLGAGEVALGWWFEECLKSFFGNMKQLSVVEIIEVITGHGKSRWRGVRDGDDGMKKRARDVMKFMNIVEVHQPNQGRIRVDMEFLKKEVQKNGGKIVLDVKCYQKFVRRRLENSNSNHLSNQSHQRDETKIPKKNKKPSESQRNKKCETEEALELSGPNAYEVSSKRNRKRELKNSSGEKFLQKKKGKRIKIPGE